MNFFWLIVCISTLLTDTCAIDSFYLPERQPNGTVVGKIQGYPPFNQDKKDETVFEVEKATGKILVRKIFYLKNLDKMAKVNGISFNVYPRDAPGFPVNVKIVQMPEFSVREYNMSMKESAKVNIQIMLPPIDKGDFNLIKFKIIDPVKEFKLKIKNTVPFLQLHSKLDYETQSIYNINVSACINLTDFCDYLAVTVNIENVNDNEPIFDIKVSQYNFEFHENATAGTLVGRVYAYDADLGKYGHVTYDLHKTDVFQINSLTGEIFIKKTLDAEERSSYTVVAIAKDDGKAPKRTTINVQFTVLDCNDNKPTIDISFTLNSNFELVENEIAGWTVAHAFVSDRDEVNKNKSPLLAINDTSNFRLMREGDEFSLKTNVVFDRETTDFVNVLLTATDNIDPSMRTYKPVRINIGDVNDNPPKFVKKIYDISVNESAKVGQHIGRINATDNDLGRNGLLKFEIEDALNLLTIDSETGDLSVAQAIDYEKVQKFAVKIHAIDHGIPALKSSVFCNIDVIDVNDNSPFFQPSTMLFTLQENRNGGIQIGHVSASDLDKIDKDRITYMISDNDGFVIDKSTGAITSTRPFDRETKKKHVLNVTAIDKAGNTGNGVVVVNIKDINDCIPSFEKSFYNLNITKNFPKGKAALAILATDPDEETNAAYSAVFNNNVFSINSQTGDLILQQDLELLSENIFVFEVHVRDNKGLPGISKTAVQINILPPSDSPPIFIKTNLNFNITENNKVGKSVGKVKAIRPLTQTGRFIIYKIAGFSPFFEIQSETGEITAKNSLDYENTNFHSLIIYAYDTLNNHLSSTIPIQINVIDENDNTPQFAKSVDNIQITEGVAIGHKIYQCHAHDKDKNLNGEIKFSVVKATGPFAVNREDCSIYSTDTIDYEVENVFTIVISATDQAPPFHTSQFQLNINVLDTNDNAPYFENSSYPVHIKEDTVVGSFITSIKATDRDSGKNGEIVYSFGYSKNTEVFTLTENGLLYLHENVDREVKDHYELSIIASDKGTPSQKSKATITVIIDDVNDHSPQFEEESYAFYLNEESLRSSYVGTIKAFDLDNNGNGKLSFKPLSNDFELQCENIGINTRCNLLSTRVFDSENGDKHFNINITASDNGTPSRSKTISVNIFIRNINDHRPEFNLQSSVFMACVAEESPKNTKIITIEASDRDIDSLPLKYHLVALKEDNADFLSLFAIDEQNGTVYTKKDIAPGKDLLFTLTVSVEEVGKGVVLYNYQKLIIVTVPLIPHQILTKSCMLTSVSETETKGKIIFQNYPVHSLYKATNFSIVDKNVPFNILANTGMVQLSKSLDSSLQHFYRFKVKVNGHWKRDKSQRYVNFITMNVYVIAKNKDVPTYPTNPERYTIDEDWPIDKPIAIFKMSMDDDAGLAGQVIYSINATDPPDIHFRLSPLKRELYLIEPIDREKHDFVSLRISVTDLAENIEERLTNTFTVYLQIKDVNDNPPMMKSKIFMQVREGEASGSTVLNIQAEDPDKGITHTSVGYRIISGNQDDTFVLNSLTGNLFAQKSLDVSKISQFKIEIEAYEIREIGSIYESLKVRNVITVSVIDINDHPPEFNQSLYTTQILENQKPGTYVTQLFYTDADILEENRQARFEFVEDYPSFTIDHKTGVITTKRVLDREKKKKHLLQVVVRDTSYQYQDDACKVRVYIQDENDNEPYFAEGDAKTVHIQENLEPSHVHSFRVNDKDNDENAAVFYTISPSQSLFDVDRTSGDLLTLKSLDREDRDTYSFTVIATNVAPPHYRTSQNVTIIIDDVNDEKPLFVKKRYVRHVQETNSINEPIVQVQAVDRDSAKYARFHYDIENLTEYFAINKDSGVISTIQPLDYEEKEVHIFEVSVTDLDTFTYDTCRVTIKIIDMNDNAPKFNKNIYEKHVNRIDDSLFVLQVKAVDADSKGEQPVSYEFEPVSHHFTIGEDSGRIYVKDKNLTPGQYRLHVKAVDEGGHMKSYVPVFVTIGNDNDTVVIFQNKSVAYQVDEIPPKGKVIGKITATAPFNQPIKYDLLQSTNYRYGFSINSDTGELYVNNSAAIDYERQPVIMLGVFATLKSGKFSSYLSVAINLNDINDNDPQIIPLNKEFDYQESSNPDNFTPHMLNSFNVRDDDKIDMNKLRIKIISGNEDEMFEIFSNWSTIMMLKKPIDYETKKQHKLVVRVYDGGNPPRFGDTTYTLNIKDRNDNPPQFQNMSPISVREDTIPGNVIGNIYATDIDESTSFIQYGGSNGDDPIFAIDETNGDIILRKHLDYETTKSYWINVHATDGLFLTNTSLQINVLDANDNAPIFTEKLYSTRVPNTIKKGKYIMRVVAYDKDEGIYGEVQYHIQPAQDAFTIEQNTGIIRTNKEYVFSENSMINKLHIRAVDSRRQKGHHEAVVAVILEVKGKKVIYPEFQQTKPYVFAVSEGSSIGASVGSVTARMYFTQNFKDNLKYSIESGNLYDSFAIDLYRGVIKVNNNLDRERKARYDLEVDAAVGDQTGVFTKCSVTIHISDINDNKPVFVQDNYSAELYENGVPGEFVITVKATDADDPLTENGIVHYELHSGQEEWLDIDSKTGKITTRMSLDREKRPFFTVSIKASNFKGTSRTSYASLNMTVLDRNDHEPQFLLDVRTIEEGVLVDENLPAGSLVFTAVAKDEDEGLNAQLIYNIRNGSGMNKFMTKDNTSGNIYTRVPLDYEQLSLYNLTVEAQDQGSPPSVSSFEYRISVRDVNEYAPQFTQDMFSFSIPANLQLGEVIGTVSAIDEDGGSASVVTYSLASSHPSPYFEVIRESGDIKLVKNLRKLKRQRRSIDDEEEDESVKKYLVTIRAENSPMDRLYSLTQVSIIVNYTCDGCLRIVAVTPPPRSMPGSTLLIVFASVSVLVLVALLACCLVYCRRKRTCLHQNKPIVFYKNKRVTIPSTSVERELLHSGHSSFDRINTHTFCEYPDQGGVETNPISSKTGLLNESSECSTSVTDEASTFSFGIYHEQETEMRPILVDGMSVNLKDMSEKEQFRFASKGTSPRSIASSTTASFDKRKKFNFKPRQSGSGVSVPPRRGSHESLKDFMEEGGGEAAGGIDVGNLLYAKLAEVEDQQEGTLDGLKPFQEEGVLSKGVSLSTIMASDDDLTSNYKNYAEWQYNSNKSDKLSNKEESVELSTCTTQQQQEEFPRTDFAQPAATFLYGANSASNNGSLVSKSRWRSDSVGSQLSRITLSDIDLSGDEDVKVAKC